LSISGITSNTWNMPYALRASFWATAGDFSSAPSAFGGTTQSSLLQSGTNTNVPYQTMSSTGTLSTGSSDLFQQLAADVQAILLQNQTGASSQSGSTSGSGAATPASGAMPVSPEQQLATDLQAFFSQVPVSESGIDASGQLSGSTQPAINSQVDATSQSQPRSHHHLHARGSPSVPTTSGDAAQPSSTDPSTSSGSDSQSTAQVFATDILQVLRAYRSQTTAATTTSLIA
jgi:hypothetical protein